jgi:ribosome maturation factor RimP
MAELAPKVGKEIERIVEAEGLELVHVELKFDGHSQVLRVDIDKEGGVTLADCEGVSRQLSAFLDVEDVIPSQYELQVSSPGLDRKFYRTSDYERFIGRLVRVRTSAPIRGLHVIVGRLESFDGQSVRVIDPKAKKGNDEYDVPLAHIKETRLEVEI